MRTADKYQIALIGLGIVATVLIAVFFSFELFPEYKIYQEDYVELENFRSTYTGEAPPDFKIGIKQILIEREDLGPPVMDRCITCHVALQFEHFSPTVIKYDINGNIVTDKEGKPVLIPNENYVWGRLDKRIAELRDKKINDELLAKGEDRLVKKRKSEADHLESLKTAKVGDHVYDVTKVLAMHPLIGKETRPFQYHPIDDYGCVSCHNGNGKAITTAKAHGPVFDGSYEIEYEGPTPEFTEKDEKNDPLIARVFNDKPGHELLFQTTPIFVGGLIEAKCVQCHQSSLKSIQDLNNTAASLAEKRLEKAKKLQSSFDEDKKSVLSLMILRKGIQQNGFDGTLKTVSEKAADYSLPAEDLTAYKNQKATLEKVQKRSQNEQDAAKLAVEEIESQLAFYLGSPEKVEKLEKSIAGTQAKEDEILDRFIEENNRQANESGSLFAKAAALKLDEDLIKHVKEVQSSLQASLKDSKTISGITTEVDELTKTYRKGQELYISQACYACHRISGFARGGVGPELTREGLVYPWFVKQSIVWPQADLRTSTMPNFHLDHEMIEPLLAFLFGQTGKNKSVSETAYKVSLLEWEAGKKLPWEQPITPAQMQDVRYAMTVFATEGCSACHRLEGFESNVGFAVEKNKEKPSFEELNKERKWFTRLVPEFVVGSELVEILQKNGEDIDKRIVSDVRRDSILEEIEQKFPGQIESHYTPFIFAKRAKNHDFSQAIAAETDPAKREKLQAEWQKWKDRVHRVLMVYVQEYGLGRLIGPRPNWSGVYRSDEWLMEHFRNPSGHVPRSIMPIFPFDETKFYALTNMLDVLGKKNRDKLREIWQKEGFNPEQAYALLCSQCHGDFLQGDGPVSEWIYPAPKNLRNADFLRNYTRERVTFSITHGVLGTPMPPWGEAAKDKQAFDGIPVLDKSEISYLVDWLFTSLSGGSVIRQSTDVPKWRYEPDDFIHELKREGGIKEIQEQLNKIKKEKEKQARLLTHPEAMQYMAALEPQVQPVAEAKKPSSAETSEIFDIVKNPPNFPDPYSYYIKKEYYTRENLDAGRTFFEINCAECHGKEADGMGARAGAMREAKPRMLINLDWQNMRDDLRLLRSIKYGVPGTAMTPWGDFTSALQRMQLVMYIRSLAENSKIREQIFTKIYQVFDHQEFLIERARVEDYSNLAKMENSLRLAKEKEKQARQEALSGQVKPEEAAKLYEEVLSAQEKVNRQKGQDQIFQDLRTTLKKEHEAYQNLGMFLVNMEGSELYVEDFLMALDGSADRYTLSDNHLEYKDDKGSEEKIKQASKAALNLMDKETELLEKEKMILTGQIDSIPKAQQLEKIDNKLANLAKLKQRWISSFAEAGREREKQAEIYKKINKQEKK